MLGGNLRWTSILYRGSRNTPGCFILQQPEISNSLMALHWPCPISIRADLTLQASSMLVAIKIAFLTKTSVEYYFDIIFCTCLPLVDGLQLLLRQKINYNLRPENCQCSWLLKASELFLAFKLAAQNKPFTRRLNESKQETSNQITQLHFCH